MQTTHYGVKNQYHHSTGLITNNKEVTVKFLWLLLMHWMLRHFFTPCS